MINWLSQQKLIVAMLAVIGSSVIIWLALFFLLFYPDLKKFVLIEKQQSQLELIFAKIPTNFKSEMNHKSQELQRQLQLSYYQSMAEYIGDFSDRVNASKLNIVSLDPKESNNQFILSAVVQGEYLDILNLLKSLVTSNYLLSVKDWSFNSDINDANEVQFEFVLATEIDNEQNKVVANNNQVSAVTRTVVIDHKNIFISKSKVKPLQVKSRKAKEIILPYKLVGIMNNNGFLSAVLEHSNGKVIRVRKSETFFNNKYKVLVLKQTKLVISSLIDKKKQWTLELGS